MSDKNQIITYIFRTSTSEDIQNARIQKIPKDYFYYYHEVEKIFTTTSVTLTSTSLEKVVNLFNDNILKLTLHFDIPLLLVIFKIRQFHKSSLIIATTPKIGICLAILKKFRLISGSIAVNIIGLYDQLYTFPKNGWFLKILSSLLTEIDLFICGMGMHEANLLAQLCCIPRSKLHFIPYCGVDTLFFQPQKIATLPFVLAIGIDPGRDWPLYHDIALQFPTRQFVWATHPTLIKVSPPPNVTIKYLSITKLREYIWSSELVLILTQPNNHLSGQASAFRTMSCGKPVILTRTKGAEAFQLQHLIHCLFVKPNSLQQVKEAIQLLDERPKLRTELGLNGRKLIIKKYAYKQIAKTFTSLIKTHLK